jgi:GNAT superfamily N-acetyltransferase
MVPVQVPLHDGTRLKIQPLGPRDRAAIAAGFERLSPRSRESRFLRPMARLDGPTLYYLSAIDGERHLAVGARSLADACVGLARCVRLEEEPEVAELAVTILDDWQRRGVAPVLVTELARRAGAVGIGRFRVLFRYDNLPVARLLKSAGIAAVVEAAGMLRADIDVATVLKAAVPASG